MNRPAPQALDAIYQAVFGTRKRLGPAPRRRAQLGACAVALVVHGAIFWLANRTEPSLETWGARLAVLVHHDLAAHAALAIEELPAPAPPPERPAAETSPAPEPSTEGSPPAPTHTPSRRAAPAPENAVAAAPTRAGQIIAAEGDPTEPVDLTGNTFVSGTASAYAGGATARHGRDGARGQAIAGTQHPSAGSSGSGAPRARPVRLPPGAWRCDWPRAALARDIYEQQVILRVVVRSDGQVERATLEDDPGDGFGTAALDCARRTTFAPAFDRAGRPIRAVSPPIRVRFTR